uniref:Nicotiana tabacum ORF n=1 Tax=Nicotiana tabacum TaxID=4097 RepID=P93388_TOBAC|nr:ORF; able to induce HR-like lesions [Nicotiana tabacum]
MSSFATSFSTLYLSQQMAESKVLQICSITLGVRHGLCYILLFLTGEGK